MSFPFSSMSPFNSCLSRHFTILILPQTQAVGAAAAAAAGFVAVTIVIVVEGAAVFHGGLLPLALANRADTLEKAGFGLLFLSNRHESPAPGKV